MACCSPECRRRKCWVAPWLSVKASALVDEDAAVDPNTSLGVVAEEAVDPITSSTEVAPAEAANHVASGGDEAPTPKASEVEANDGDGRLTIDRDNFEELCLTHFTRQSCSHHRCWFDHRHVVSEFEPESVAEAPIASSTQKGKVQ